MYNSGSSGTSGSVVVGVDRSAGARAALRWAMAEARLRKTRLRIVHAWTFSYPGAAGYGYMGETRNSFPDSGLSKMHRASEHMVERAIADLGAEADGIEIEREIIEGTAADVLLGAVTEDDLLVVGSRGHGGFVGLLLGSVSHQCAHHARCPVVVVHAPSRAGSAEAQPASTRVAA